MKVWKPGHITKAAVALATGLGSVFPVAAFAGESGLSAESGQSGVRSMGRAEAARRASLAPPAEPLERKLLVARPADVPASQRNPSIARGLGLAFNKDDLDGLYGSRSFGSCETKSPGPSPFAKNFSNFGRDCFRAQADAFYLNADVAMRKNGNHLGRPSYAWNGVTLQEISTPLGTRFAGRAATEAVGENAALRNLVNGTVALNFTLGGLWDSMTAEAAEPARPRYVLRVTQVRKAPTGVETRVAALGDASLAYVWSEESDFEIGERAIVEEWDAPAAPRTEALPNLNATLGQRLARGIGVSHAPFSRYAMRLERKPAGNQEAIAARFAEANDVAWVELTNVLGKGEMAYGAKMPYFRHSVSVRYPKQGASPVTGYGYLVDSSNKGEVTYDSNTRGYAASFVSKL